eukprot:TRINITY_DN4848_c0_g1_i1.p1 TRINITY_DN4848_c0_g1~~TRINITY_DN4848_c0_g1_i1.p1  ORF type:complete len:157 (-),score=53.91 TRINITY_DN4848_c0_g1_i1:47-517(-)
MEYVCKKRPEDFVDNNKPYAKLIIGKREESSQEKEKSEMKEERKEDQPTLPAPNVIRVSPMRRHESCRSRLNNSSRMVYNTSVNINELYGKITAQWLLVNGQRCRKQQEEILEHLSMRASRLSKVSMELSNTLRMLEEQEKERTKESESAGILLNQ